MDKKTRRQIEYAFYNYQALKKEAAPYLAELAEKHMSPSLDRVGKGAGIAKPTENAAMQFMQRSDELTRKYLWCEVVENTFNAFAFEPEYYIMVELYINKKKIQELIISHKSQNTNGLWQSTFWRWREKWLDYAYKWAKKYKLLQGDKQDGK